MSVENAQPIKILKIMFVGDISVGKTVFLKRYVTGEFDDHYIATVGLDFMRKNIEFCENAEDEEKPARNLMLQLWDTAGQERFESITRVYYKSAKGFILMFDVTNEKSFQNLDKWLDGIKAEASVVDPKIILCGNKMDKEGERQVDVETAKKKAEELGLEYFETSASTGENINEAMDCLVHSIMLGKAPEGESSDEEADEEAIKKEVAEKVKLGEENPPEKKASKCPC